MRSKFLRAAGGGGPIDPLFKNTTLLLHGDGTNGGQNNTFLDSSTNNFAVTRNGNVTQGSFSPFTNPGGYWSTYFDGTTDRLTYSSLSSVLTTGEHTVECWVLAQSLLTGTNLTPITGTFRWSFGNNNGWVLALNSSGNVTAQGSGGVWNASSTFLTTTSAITLGTWTHIAWTRDASNVMRIFINGVLGASATVTQSMNLTGTNGGDGSSQGLNIGTYGPFDGNFTNFFTGYISNLHISTGIGSCKYTSDFTPPTAPITQSTGSQLITCSSNRSVDLSSFGRVVSSTAGEPRTTTLTPLLKQKPYNATLNGGSGYFDGTGDYLDLPSSANYSITNSTTPFTFEAFIYPRAGSVVIFTETYTGTGDTIPLAVTLSNGTTVESLNGNALCFGWYNGSSWVTAAASNVNVNLNEWSHIACVFTGSTSRIYINGVDVTKTSSPTPATSWGVTGDPGDVWRVGQRWDAGVPLGSFNGFISNLRFVRGAAVYTSGFTTPVAPLTPIDNTTLLLNFTNSAIIDNKGLNVLETVQNAQISTADKQYGTGSLLFDGNTDGLTIVNANQSLNFASNNFTIEFWTKLSALSRTHTFFRGDNGAASGIGIDLGINSTNQLVLALNGGAPNLVVVNQATHNMTTNVWYHIAAVRSGNTWTLYVNGVSVGSTSNTSAVTSPTFYRIGSNSFNTTFSLQGYLDDFRVTLGVARYTANFTPPAAPFEDR